MARHASRIFLLLLSFSLVSPLSWAAQDGSIQIKGSDTMVNLVQAWAEAYMTRKPEAFVAVTGGGSGTGFAALIGGTCDIAMTSRSIKDKEIELAGKRGRAPKEHVVGLDGLAVVVHASNPVHELTMDQLEGIFSGRIKNWKELGGEDAGIVVLSREVNSGTHVYFKEHVLQRGDSAVKTEFAPQALMLPSSQAIADEVAHNRAAIGYYGMGYISPQHRAVSVAPAEGQPYVYPDLDHVISGAYPISRPLLLYTDGEPSGDAKDFLDFVFSPEGQKIVEETDFVPVRR